MPRASANPLLSVKLTCGHFVRLKRSRLQGINPCPKCLEFGETVGYWSREWRAFCHSCNWARWFGQDQETAMREGASHNRPTHMVTVVYDALESPTPKDRQPVPDQATLFEYPGDDELPPF